MQINRLSIGLQEELKRASGYNDERVENLFPDMNGTSNSTDFSNVEIDDLNISEDQIRALLGSFTDEIIKVFGAQFAPPAPVQQQAQTQESPESETSDSSESSSSFIA